MGIVLCQLLVVEGVMRPGQYNARLTPLSLGRHSWRAQAWRAGKPNARLHSRALILSRPTQARFVCATSTRRDCGTRSRIMKAISQPHRPQIGWLNLGTRLLAGSL